VRATILSEYLPRAPDPDKSVKNVRQKEKIYINIIKKLLNQAYTLLADARQLRTLTKPWPTASIPPVTIFMILSKVYFTSFLFGTAQSEGNGYLLFSSFLKSKKGKPNQKNHKKGETH
jgi:hypothetical protein